MRKILLATTLGTALCCGAQDNYKQLLVSDPYESNGYFIADMAKFNNLGIDHAVIKIFSRVTETNGSVSEQQIASMTIDSDQPWGHVESSLLDGLPESTQVVYSITGLTSTGTVVVDINAWTEGPIGVPMCNQVCEQNTTGWRLNLTTSGAVTDIWITNPGLYFYIPSDRMQEFMLANDPPGYLDLGSWSNHVNQSNTPGNPNSIACFPIDFTPQYATAENGFPLPYPGGPVWAIRKSRGDYRDLHTPAVYGAPGSMCDNGGGNLVVHYNNDDDVEDAILGLNILPNPGPLNCANGTLSTSFDPAGNGLDVGCTWIELMNNTAEIGSDGEIQFLEELLYVLHCEEGGDGSTWPSIAPLAQLAGVMINQWEDGLSTNKVSIEIPKSVDNKPIDPKLIPVTKTYLTEGLYEVLIIRHDGSITRHFEELTAPVTIKANFESFVSINIYPVPVKDGVFAIDFDLLFPTSLNLTIVNNMGVTYHTDALDFELAGLNKHVIKMNTPWPNGLYHAIFQFPNGSAETISFNVDH